MTATPVPTASILALEELLSASSADSRLRSRLKARPAEVLAMWGVTIADRTVRFVEPGEAPEAPATTEVFVELPPLKSPAALSDDVLDAVAGGYTAIRQPEYWAALSNVKRAVSTLLA